MGKKKITFRDTAEPDQPAESGQLTGGKKPRGRPRKEPDKAKGLLLQVRLEPAEKQAFSEAAELSGQALSVWVRDQLRQAAQKKLEQYGRPIAFLPTQPQETR